MSQSVAKPMKNPKEQIQDGAIIVVLGLLFLLITWIAKKFHLPLINATYWVLAFALISSISFIAYFLIRKINYIKPILGPKLRLGKWAKPHFLERSIDFDLPLMSLRHILITGVTGCGKSTLIRRMLSELNSLKRGYLYIDFKGEEREMQEIINGVRLHNRENEFQIFDLSRPETCETLNLLTIFRNIDETVGFVMEIFEFENEYYKSQAEQLIRYTLNLFDATRELRSFDNIRRLISNEGYRLSLLQHVDVSLHRHAFFEYFTNTFNQLKPQERDNLFSGLQAKLSQLVSGQLGAILNARESTFDIARLFDRNRPTVIRVPGEAYGDLSKNIVQAILKILPVLLARRRIDLNPKDYFIFMDEQCSYTSDTIVDLLKKAGSARVHCILTRQCDGDFDSHSEGFLSKVVSTCSAQFIFQVLDANTRDSLAKLIGTKKTTKETRRVSQGSETGEASARDVHEFKIAPEDFADLKPGECFVSLRTPDQTLHRKIQVYPPQLNELEQYS